MSDHTFKTNFVDLPEAGSVQENYDFPSNVRDVNFVLSDGDEIMLNYAYLLSVKLYKGGEKNLLKVTFTSDVILIEGYRLWLLRDLFRQHIPKDVAPSSSRYTDISKPAFISNIAIGM